MTVHGKYTGSDVLLRQVFCGKRTIIDGRSPINDLSNNYNTSSAIGGTRGNRPEGRSLVADERA
uniref:Uncharacterized protein n=1 Tax=Kalanchoe fedtschenkoi TaxID=63787 RepID=A0A7N0T453_KALFE